MSNLLDQFGDVLIKKSDKEADLNIKVVAEDFSDGAKFEWEDYFFEPKAGEKYVIKLLISPGEDEIVHKQVFTNVPNPNGGVFRYALPAGYQDNDPYFVEIIELYKGKKSGDLVSEKKAEMFGKKKQQGCVKIQILQSPVREDIGKIKLMAYQSFGPNAKIAEMIKAKISPSQEQLDAGVEKENIFSIFETSVMHIICKSKMFEGKEGRDLSESLWSTKKTGAYVKLEDGREHQFTTKDVENGKIKDEVKPFFEQLIVNLTENSIYDYFGPKIIGDPRNSEEDEKYLKDCKERADKAAELLEEMTLEELITLSNKATKKSKEGNIHEESIPDDLQDTVQASQSTSSQDTVTQNTIDDSDEIAKLL